MSRTAARGAALAAGVLICGAATAGCGGGQETQGSGPGREQARPAARSGSAAELPSQVGRGLLQAVDATVHAHLGYGVSEANGGGQLQRVDPADWQVCFQKTGPLPDSVIFGVVRTGAACPAHWTDKLD
ncbi:hypothetical protein G3I40_45070 [Streptomyces sp. SID14478]|uniref:hypothetical protein n=1 Tax=Streptomyces sp. SID14478 TaxID=2706073 RepID=UPI0013DEEB80|nr:hypothetical protein [Streptomyces sp. SID14478]NEB82334.1 hypothetical protein [Streptomyces sp. SID14478]